MCGGERTPQWESVRLTFCARYAKHPLFGLYLVYSGPTAFALWFSDCLNCPVVADIPIRGIQGDDLAQPLLSSPVGVSGLGVGGIHAVQAGYGIRKGFGSDLLASK